MIDEEIDSIGRLEEQEGRYPEAMDVYGQAGNWRKLKEILDAHPSHAVYEKFREWAEIAPEDSGLEAYLGTYEAIERQKQAVIEAEAAKAEDLQTKEEYLAQARVHESQGDFTGAVQFFVYGGRHDEAQRLVDTYGGLYDEDLTEEFELAVRTVEQTRRFCDALSRLELPPSETYDPKVYEEQWERREKILSGFIPWDTSYKPEDTKWGLEAEAAGKHWEAMSFYIHGADLVNAERLYQITEDAEARKVFENRNRWFLEGDLSFVISFEEDILPRIIENIEKLASESTDKEPFDQAPERHREAMRTLYYEKLAKKAHGDN